jgi:hypothetical protein
MVMDVVVVVKTKDDGRKEVIPTQFLAKPGAGRAQLGVFGHSGAIEAIYFSF